MKNITGKNKWTKKLRAVVISLALIFAVALGGACAAIGLSVADRNQRLGGYLAGSTANDNTATLPTPEETFAVDGDTYKTNADAWEAAVEYSVSHNNALVQFDLTKSWTANATTGFGTATETNSPYGAAGSLNVPAGASVILNISEKVRLNRNVGATAIENGEVITVSGGRLVIQGDGVITGGNTTGNGGGINSVQNSTKATVEIYGGTITRNSATGGAGGVFVSGSSTLIMNGGKILDNSTSGGGGGVFVGSGATFIMNDGSIDGNKTTGSGGAVYANGNTLFVINGGTFNRNTAGGHGGAIVSVAEGVFDEDGEMLKGLSINGETKIINNTAGTASYGGGVYSTGTLIINGGTISGNTAANGGGVYNNFVGEKNANGTIKTYGLTINGGTVSNNSSSGSGAGVCVHNNGTGVFNGGEIINNTTNYRGGGVFIASGVFEMNGGKISSNKTTGSSGGGVYAYGSTKFILNDGEISSNSVFTGFSGGAIFAITIDGGYETTDIGNIEINGGTISENKAASGGGIYMGTGVTLTMNGGTIDGNTAKDGNGGGIFSQGDLVLKKGTVSNNQALGTDGVSGFANRRGGGIWAEKGSVIIGDADDETEVFNITDNTAKWSGGGIYIYSNDITEAKIYNANFSNNTSIGGDGGGVCVISNAGLEIEGGTISNNKAETFGGGLYSSVSDAETIVRGTQITGNHANNQGGGIKVHGGTLTLSKTDSGVVPVVSNNRVGVATVGNGGGGVAVNDASKLIVTECIFEGNIQGAIYSAAGDSVITLRGTKVNGEDSIKFLNNKSTVNGAAVVSNSSTWEEDVENVTFEGNESLGYGGAFSAYNVNFVNSTFKNNKSGVEGGAIALHGFTYGINGCTFTGNTALYGGAVRNSGTTTIENSRFENNSAEAAGGAIYALNGTTTLIGVTVTGNSAPTGGGIFVGATTVLGGTIIVKDNTGASSTTKNNVTINTDNKIRFASPPTSFDINNSRVGLNTTANNTLAGGGFGCCANDTISTNLRNKLSTIFSADLAGQTVTSPSTTTSSGGYYLYITGLANTTAAANATQWVNAATNSSDSNPMTVTLTADWTATTSGSGASLTSSFGTNATGKKGYYSGTLHVPAGANIILNLNGHTIDRALSTRTGVLDQGRVINVDGTLTIIGSGTIKGGNVPSGGGICVSSDNAKLTMNGGTITGNKAQNGGGVYILNKGTFIMNGGKVSGNTASEHGGGVHVTSNGTFEMNDGEILGNTATGNGGGVYNAGTFTMNGGTIGGQGTQNGTTVRNGNVGACGGGLSNLSGSFTMNGGTIYANAAINAGGAIYSGGNCTITINNGTIGNSNPNLASYANNSGGGIYLNQGTLTMNGGTIIGNQSMSGDGGGILAQVNTTVHLLGGQITGNSARNGGGIVVAGGTSTNKATLNIGAKANGKLSGSAIISGNHATGTATGTDYLGGGIMAGEYTTVNFYGGTVKDNDAKTGGGGIATTGKLNMEGGTISGNTSANYGGGVYVGGAATMTMSGGKISKNAATTNGGGINSDGIVIMTGGEISENTATNQGGGVCFGLGGTFMMGTVSGSGASAVYSGKGKILDNTVTNGNGGGVWTASDVNFKLYGGSISGNTATQPTVSNDSVARGGGLWVSGPFEMYGGLISENTAAQWGGGIMSYKTVKIYGGTISYNTVTTYRGGGILVDGASTLEMTGGEIIYNKAAENGGGICVTGSTVTLGGTALVAYNTTSGNGGGIQVGYGTTSTGCKLIMNGGTIKGNTAVLGGGVYLLAGTFTMNGGVIEDNKALEIGGGVFSVGSSFKMTAGTITGNQSTNAGGVCVSGSCQFEISGTAAITGNTSTGISGGVTLAGTSALTMSGGAITDNVSTSNGGGICVADTSTFTMSGGTISDNTAQNGGGVFINNNGKFEMSGTAKISDNTAQNGGGVYVNTSKPFTMTGGVIDGNTAQYGGGVYNAATFTMSGGEISGNEANIGGGVYVSGSFTTQLGAGGVSNIPTISGNTAVYGGGVYVDDDTFTSNPSSISGNEAEYGGGVYIASGATFNHQNGGGLSKNVASKNGGGVYNCGTFNIQNSIVTKNTAVQGGGVFNSDTFDMNGGEISGNEATSGGIYNDGTAVIYAGSVITENSATSGGGIYNADDLTLGYVSITDNYATSSGAGVRHASDTAIKFSGGQTRITENFIGTPDNASREESNLYSKDEYGSYTVVNAFTGDSKIGITYIDDEGRVSTSPFTSSFGTKNSGKHPRTVFYSDKKRYTVGVQNGEGILVACNNVDFTVYDKDGNETDTTLYIKVDTGSTVTYALSADKKKMTFTTTEGGLANIKTDVTVPVVPGYTPYVYNPDDGNAEVLSGEGVFANVSANLNLNIGYKADADTEYKVYYILQQANVTTNSGYVTATTPSELNGLSSVKVYTGHGTTDGPLAYLGSNGLAFVEWDTKQHYSFDTINVSNPTIAGDGSSYVLVYLKLNEYTVTYNATGATPSKQTRKLRYGATVVAPARTPSKAMSKFEGWLDPSGNLINFATTTLTVQGNMTLTAKFKMDTFNVYFNLNIDGYDEDTALPSNSELVVPTGAGLEDVDYLVTWDYEKLFPAASGFNFRADGDNYGTFIIDYTIDNIPNTMSIKNVKPTAVGYTFDGWYLNDTLVTTIQRPNINTDKFLELTAHWSPASYTMRFDKEDGSWNSVSSTTVTNMSLMSDILPEPTPRGGYIFGGWYVTSAYDTVHPVTRHTPIDQNAYVSPYDGKKYFSIAKIADLYGNEADGYNFSGLTLYAEWTSEDIYVLYTGDEYVSLEFKNADNHNGSIGVKAQAMHVGDVVTVTPTARNGYKFLNLIVNNRPQPEGVTEFTIRDTYLSEYEYNGNTYKVIKVSAAYSEESYVINYDVDGGTSTSVNFSRTYTPSQLLPNSPNRAKLSSRLTKQGYDFMGWELTSNHELAFTLDAGVDGTKDLFGKNLWMATPTKEDGITPDYREVFLKAIWKPQPAKVNLYNATYNNLYEGSDETGYYIEDYRAEGAVSSKKLETAMDIKIVNPVREAFDFLGWATSRNGAVVYPVVEGVNTIDYKVNADHDINGNALNRNNLYAVWHIKGVDRINMTVTNNGCTYGGSGITMSAKPAQSYEVADGATINLTYKWYRVFDGMYDDCFTLGKVFVNNGKVTGYEFNGKYYESDGKTEVTTKPAGEEFEYRRFDESSVGTGCKLEYTQNRTPAQTSTLTIRDVVDCGTYICVVEVEATVGGDSTTRTGGYGEIEISMDKAVYGNLVLANATKAYNGKVQTSAVRLELAKSDNATLAQGEDGVWYLSLPDHRLNAGGTRIPDTNSKVIVTYSYFVEDGNARREITDLNETKNVGRYYVVVSFAFTPDGDKGNYEALEPIEAELIITPFEISKIGYTLVHGDEKSTTTFSGAYDGVAYTVEAAINSRFGLDGTGDLVTDVDDVKLAVVVNAVSENGDDELSEAELPTVEAGVYSVVVTGLTGQDAGNYVLKSSATLRKEYTITKNVYEVSGKIKFEDKTEVFNNTLKTLEIEWEGEWPSTVTPRYRVVSYEQEDGQFTKNDHLEDNFNALGNAGRYAGIYTIEVTFEDSESDNYEALETMTAELTITKANIFDYMRAAHGEDLLTAAGFVSGSFSFNANKSYLPVIDESIDCRLNDKDNYKITYSYYSVDETTGERASLDKNGDGVIQDSEKIFEAGKYDIVANIEYVSSLYRNNFEEIQESESTITYVIRNVDVESVTVTFTDEFEAGGRVAKYGEGFSYSWIKQIDVAYVDKDNNNERSVRHITSESDIALSLITLERNDSIFWHVGEFNVKVGMYGSNSDDYVLNVKQEISQVKVQYSKNESAYVTVDEDGVELEDGAQYEFQIIYSGVNVNGTTVNGMISSVEAASALKLGKNVLTADVANYIFTEEITVNMYKVINKDVTELTWQYSKDGGSSWTDLEENEDGGFTLPYVGTEYLIRVTFEDDGEEQSCMAKAESGLSVLSYRKNGYYMQVGRSGNYKIDAHCGIAISQRVIEVGWSDENKAFTYNGLHQAPEVTSDNLTVTDNGKVTFSYQLEDEDGNALGEHDVIGAGTYVIKVVLSSEDGTANNYTVVGSETAKHTFVIGQAEVAVSVIYSESNYGPNVTYAGNEHGLRLNAIKPTFESGAIDGRFAFIKYGDDGKLVEILGNDEWIKSQLTGTPDHAEIDYAFIPDDENYKVTTGQLSLTVKAQTYKTGTGALLIELGDDATHFYLIGGTFKTEGINVYRVYQSYYTEGDQWYGFRGNAIKNANLRINNEAAEGRTIREEDVSGGMITLTAISGTNTGSIEIPVIDKEAVKLEITSTGYRTVYYIGETYDFSDLEFKVTFEDDTDQSGLKKGTVKCDFDGKEFDTTGEKVITFTLFGATCELKVEVKDKENLQIVEFTTSEKTLIWTGEELTAPALKFSIDGKTYTEYDGIKVTCRVMQGQQEVTLKNEGTYSVYYTVTVTNPRFNKIATPKLFAMEVTKNPYRLTITTPAEGELSATYTGSNIEIPKPEIGEIIDSRTNEVVAPDSISYTINGTALTRDEVAKPWNRLNAGTYVVEVVVTVDGREFSETYTFTIAKATNGGMTIETSMVVLHNEANFRFPVTANFGASTVTYTYSQSRNGEYTSDVPATAGIWFVKATIAGTDNYTGLEIVESFEVRDNSADASVGEGSISGGDGIGKDWTLEINRMEAEAVSQVSISKQDVHDGYEVVLKDEHGLKVEDIEKAYTVRIKLADELSGRSDLKVFFKDADGNTREMKVDEIRDGYIQFKTSEFGTFIITSAQPKASVGLLVAVIVLGVVAAGMITACIIVFVKKKKKGEQQ